MLSPVLILEITFLVLHIVIDIRGQQTQRGNKNYHQPEIFQFQKQLYNSYDVALYFNSNFNFLAYRDEFYMIRYQMYFHRCSIDDLKVWCLLFQICHGNSEETAIEDIKLIKLDIYFLFCMFPWNIHLLVIQSLLKSVICIYIYNLLFKHNMP